MIFTLEALQAEDGDCLILHYGPEEKPSFILIDGGPNKKNWEGMIRKRLLEIKHHWSPDQALPLSLVMVSHIDNDHITGIEYLLEELAQADEDKPALWEIFSLWHNSFDDIIGNRGVDAAALIKDATENAGNQRDLRSVAVAGVNEGRNLCDLAKKLGLLVNHPFDGLVRRADDGKTLILWDELKITILHPATSRLQKLQAAWDEKLREYHEKGDKSIIQAAYKDNSPFNLSSIVTLVELDGKKVLLTGDARGDDIIDGLVDAGLLTNDKDSIFEVELLKLPHHGSEHNVTEDFFRRVRAKHYVISADGRFGNPDRATLDMLVNARPDDDFTIHLTNEKGREEIEKNLKMFFSDQSEAGRQFKRCIRNENEPSIKCDLASPIEY